MFSLSSLMNAELHFPVEQQEDGGMSAILEQHSFLV